MAGRGGHTWNPHGERNPAWRGGPITDPEWFRQRYEVEGMSLRQVAKTANRSVRTAARWAAKHGIKMRNPAEALRTVVKRGPQHHGWNPAIQHECIDCGTPVAAPRSSPSRCLPCNTKRYAGCGNPNYKGITDIKKLVRQHSNDHWRLLVFERDGFCCRSCGDASGRNLRAHHIRRFGAIIEAALVGLPTEAEADRLAAVAALKENAEINNVSNGVTLCASCHDALHLGERADVVPWENQNAVQPQVQSE